MKGKRQSQVIGDFSGGLLTNSPLVGTDIKYTPDCLNVYAEGKSLRKRLGVTTLNPTTVAGNPNGNGIINWVLNASQQYLMVLFGTSLKQMSISGNSWSGTFSTISPGTGGSTNLSDAIMSSVTYSGNLIMTTENRDKPQVLTTTATSYINIDNGGTGTAPQCKYLQVWKTHLWMLNLGGGGSLTEDGTTISPWTNNDVGTGSSTQTTFLTLDTFRFHGGTNASDNARRTRSITASSDYSAEIKTYFATIGAVTSNDYAWMDIYNGTIRFRSRWSTNGLQVFDGAAWNNVGVALVSTGTWNTWKFLVTGGTATGARVDIYQDGNPVALGFSCANASTASSGQIDLVGNAGGSANRMDWYMDYLYLNSMTARTNYYTDGDFESWVSSSQASYTDTVLPTQPYLHLKCNDNAANSTVTDNGSGANNGTSNNTAGVINTSVISVTGKINSAFNFDGSTQFCKINASVATVTADSSGSICFWINPASISAQAIFSGCGTFNNSDFLEIGIDTGNVLNLIVKTSAVGNKLYTVTSGINSNTYTHIAVVQSGTPTIYINAVTAVTTYTDSTDKSAWFSVVGSVMTSGRIGSRVDAGVESTFFNGKIDDVRYYRTVLTSSDIQAIYAEGNGNEAQPATVREGTTFQHGTFAYRINNDGAYAVVSQTVTSTSSIAGVLNYFGAWCNVTNNATYKLRVNDGTSNYDSSVLTGNGTWQYQTLSFTPLSSAGTVRAQMILTSASTAIFDVAGISQSSSGVTQDLSDRIQRTAIATYNDFSGTDSGNNDITTAGDIGLTGSGILNDKMYVFKKWSIHRITYTGSTPLLDIKQAKSTVGTASPRSIKNIDLSGSGEVLIFLGTDRRIYIFDGYASMPISDNISVNNGISSVYMKNINAQALDKVYAVVHSDLSWYELFVPIGSNTTPNYSIIVDFSKKDIVFWPNDNRNFLSGSVSDNGAGQRVVYAQGNTDGKVYLTISGSSDAGSSINGYWTSFKVGSPVLLGRIDEIEVQTDSVVCNPTFKWRMDWESSWISKTLNASTYTSNYDPGRIDNLSQFYFVDNSTASTFKLWSIAMYERVLGGGK